MKISQDRANRLAVAIRDLIGYTDGVTAFLEKCELPRSIVIEVKTKYKEKVPTIKVVHHVLSRLGDIQDEGIKPIRNIMTAIYYWNDLHTVDPKRKDAAAESLRAFRLGYERYRAQKEFAEAQQKQEIQMQSERLQRDKVKELDHVLLHSLRDEFDSIQQMSDTQERGNRLEAFFNKLFDHYCHESKGPVRRVGEQIDGVYKLDNHWHYVEVRWKAAKADAADVSVLRDRATRGFGGDTKALFISFNGFTSECLDSLKNNSDERVLLMDGYDLRCVLNCDIALDILLAEKQADIVRNRRPFISCSEIIRNRLLNA